MANKKKKKTSIGTKIFVWFMFLIMFGSFLSTIIYYIIAAK